MRRRRLVRRIVGNIPVIELKVIVEPEVIAEEEKPAATIVFDDIISEKELYKIHKNQQQEKIEKNEAVKKVAKKNILKKSKSKNK